MLLREFAVENHTISLIEEDELYIAIIKNKNGEKLLYNEYKDYEKIKNCFDTIVQSIERDNIGIGDVIKIIERSTV